MADNIETIDVKCPYCGSSSLCKVSKVLRYTPFYAIDKHRGKNGKLCCTENEDSIDWDEDDVDYSYDDGKPSYSCSACGHSWLSLEAFVEDAEGKKIIERETVM